MGKRGRTVSFKCLGTNKNDTLRWLAVENGEACLVGSQEHQNAKWIEHVLDNGDMMLECAGVQSQKRFLYGRTGLDAGQVTLTDMETARKSGSGGRWLYDIKGENISLKCLGKTQGRHWIDGITMRGQLQLVPEHEVERKSGTRWQILTIAEPPQEQAVPEIDNQYALGQPQTPVNRELLDRMDEVIAKNMTVQWVIVGLAVLLCLAGIGGIVAAVMTGEYAWTIPSAFVVVMIHWPIKHIGSIRDKNIRLGAAPALISQLPQHLAEAEIQKLLNSLHSGE